MAKINVSLKNNASKSFIIILPEGFTREQFTKAATDKVGPVDGFRFVMDGKQLNLDDETIFNQQKAGITEGKEIFVLERLRGGGYAEMSILIDIILAELTGELKKISHKKFQCTICMESKQCLQVHCGNNGQLCDDCFTTYFKSNNLKVKCVICHQEVPYDRIFVTRDFITSLRSLDELKALMSNIDCQICTCGTLVINETLYPRQTCLRCERTFCFFCNKDWNNDTMLNVTKYTCTNNCDYETRITFHLVRFAYSQTFQVPDRRCCPKCFNMGAYGERCKYHECGICGHTFCFLCLESEDGCGEKYGKIYSQQCCEPQPQQYSMFPCING